MEGITVEIVSKLATIIATLFFGFISKKFNIIESKYIPYQNLMIGFITGVICYMVGLEQNLIVSIVGCLASTMIAGGTYDVIHTSQKE